MMRSGAMAAGAFAASGCVGLFDPPTDPNSPVSARVDALVAANREYPRWEDFPPAPVGLPEPAEIAARVDTLKVEQAELAGQVAAIDWTLDDPAGFAAAITSRIDAGKASPVTARTQADIEDFARRLRERAIAPPPVPRR